MKIIKASKGEEILVDDKDYKLLSKYKWLVDYRYNRPSAIISTQKINKKTIRMNRFILNYPNDMVVDHIDGNVLNNQRNNLRVCTQQQNSLNRKIPTTNKTGYRGVQIEKSKRNNGNIYLLYRSTITFNKKVYKKTSKDINICIEWRKIMEEKLFGDFRRAN